MTTCRACQQYIIPFFSLGKMPLVNSFLRKRDIPHEEEFDLTVGFCPNCYLVQLMHAVDPEIMFRKYLYFSSATRTIVSHSNSTAVHLIDKLQLNSRAFVIEVGSNDGVQLKAFKDYGIDVLGVDPARNIAKVANACGIRTISEFFNLSLATRLDKDQVHADLLYGANVFAHIPHIIDFISGVKLILKPHGSAVFEFPHLVGLFENKFDTIYHEHVFYYSALAVRNLVQRVGLELYDVEHIPMQGGSLRVYICHKGMFKQSKTLVELLKQEKERGFEHIRTYQTIRTNVEKLKKDLISLLKGLCSQKKHIAAYGAPAKGMILLNYFKMKRYLDFIVDKSVDKQGLYTPGSHMKIYPVDKVKELKPEYLLVLCWNIIDEVMSDLEDYRKTGGKFIQPVPRITVR